MHTLSNVQKIAVLKASALGDFIVTLPALEAIRSKWPSSEIILLGKSWHKEYLLKGRTPVDRVIPVPPAPGITLEPGQLADAASLASFFDAMQQEQFDIIFNFQGNGLFTNAYVKQMHPRQTVGPLSAGAEQPDCGMPYFYYQNEVVRYVELVAAAISGFSVQEPVVRVMPEDLKEVRELIVSVSGNRYVVLHPFARDIRRMWPLENYIELGNSLREHFDTELIVTGLPEERAAVEEMIRQMKFPAINASGMLGLGGLTALLAGASLVIAPDTGPLHLARAVQTPTTGIYWAANYVKWGPLTRTIHRPVISWIMQCPLCGIIPNDPYPFEPRTVCDHAVSFVRDISVETVFGQAAALLSGPSVPDNPACMELEAG